MSNRANMIATLADIRSKKQTPGRARAAANIEAALARMDAYASKAPNGGGHVRAMTVYDREKLMLIVEDGSRSIEVRDRAKRLLDASGNLSQGDLRFISRASGDAD